MQPQHKMLLRGTIIAGLIVWGVAVASNWYDSKNLPKPLATTLQEQIKPPELFLKRVSRQLAYVTPTRPAYIQVAGHEFDEHVKNYLANRITLRYTKVDSDLAFEIVQAAYKYEDPVFPKATDIIAIAAIESSFRPNVASNLKSDKAVGLMQVRPGVWRHKVDVNKMHIVEYQIKYGAEILNEYFQRANSRRGAVQSYNIGITAFVQKNRTAPKYLSKYQRELAYFSLEN